MEHSWTYKPVEVPDFPQCSFGAPQNLWLIVPQAAEMQNLLYCLQLSFCNWVFHQIYFKNYTTNIEIQTNCNKFHTPVACGISNILFWRVVPSSCLTNVASSLSPNKINFNISKGWKWPLIKLICQKVKSPNPQFFWLMGESFNFIMIPDCPLTVVHPLPGKGQIGHNNLENAMYTSTKETVRKRSTT